MERKFLFVLGVMLINNLYVFTSKYTALYYLTFALMGAVAAFYFFLRFHLIAFIKSINSLICLFIIFFSIILFIVDSIFFKNDIDPNDFIRVILLLFYFSWVLFFFRYDAMGRHKFLYAICTTSLIILAVISLLQYFYLDTYLSLLNDKYTALTLNNRGRVGATLIDSNYLAAAVVLHLGIIWQLRFMKGGTNTILYFFYLITGLIINISGSRLGFIMFSFFSCVLLYKGHLFPKNIKLLKYFFALIAMATIMLGIIITTKLRASENPDPLNSVTVIERIFGDTTEYEKATQSTRNRLQSLIEGAHFSKNYLYLIGPGALTYYDAWRKKESGVVPHNTFIFMYTQFGLLSIAFSFFLLLLLKKAIRNHSITIYILYLLPLALLPNYFYYPISFLALYFIESVSLSLFHTAYENSHDFIEFSESSSE